MEENQWLKTQLIQLEKESQDYKQKALLQETLALLLEQEKEKNSFKENWMEHSGVLGIGQYSFLNWKIIPI